MHSSVSDSALDLGYAFAPPATVYVTVDDQHPVENTLTLVVTNRSGAAVQFQNPQALTPGSPDLPKPDDTASPLGRISVWFPWGDASGDLATAGDSQKIVAGEATDGWYAPDRVTDPTLGTYWILFPQSKSVFLEQDASISVEFSGIVSHIGSGGTLPEQSWMTALPRVPGYASAEDQTAVWKDELSATLTAPATAIPGDQIELTWQTSGVKSCDLDPGGFKGLPPTGIQAVVMLAQQSVTWTLTGYLSAGAPVYAKATVTAQTGWIELGPCPYGGATVLRVGSEFLLVDRGVSDVW